MCFAFVIVVGFYGIAVVVMGAAAAAAAAASNVFCQTTFLVMIPSHMQFCYILPLFYHQVVC